MNGTPSFGRPEDLERYMAVLLDVRRAAVIICDSIRVREDRALKRLGVSVDEGNEVEVEDSGPRCPICFCEYEYPTVIIFVCGHGTHKGCMQTFFEKNGNGNISTQVFTCPLCRAAFCEEVVVLTVSVLPNSDQAAAWRTVQLTAPWKDGPIEDLSRKPTERTVEGLAERLYISLRAIFQDANQFSRAIGGMLCSYDDATKALESARTEAADETDRVATLHERKKEQFSRWRKKLESREKRLLPMEYQNESFLAQCAKAVRRDEFNNLKVMESMIRQQKSIDRKSDELMHMKEKLDDARANLNQIRNRETTGMGSAGLEGFEERRNISPKTFNDIEVALGGISSPERPSRLRKKNRDILQLLDEPRPDDNEGLVSSSDVEVIENPGEDGTTSPTAESDRPNSEGSSRKRVRRNFRID